jgi:glycerol dehydrogenase
MITTSIFPGRYVQGANALGVLSEEVARQGSKALLLVDAFVESDLGEDISRRLRAVPDAVFDIFNGECCDSEIERIKGLVASSGADVIVGVGGGKTLDTAKAVAHETSSPIIIVPTIASTDAPCSALSVIYTETGEFSRYLVLPHNPNVVIVDSTIIVKAPPRFLVAGMGDALATWLEAESCRVRMAANMTGRAGTMTAYALARLCYETLLEYGPLALTACRAGAVTPALEHVIEANTLLSGLGFESGGLASCHAIHNGLTALEETHAYWHGEKVAIGVLASLFLTDKSKDMIDEIYDFCGAIGLPTTLADIGLGNAGDDKLMVAATAACAAGETIHNEPSEVSPEIVLWALKAADAEGARRKV